MDNKMKLKDEEIETVKEKMKARNAKRRKRREITRVC